MPIAGTTMRRALLKAIPALFAVPSLWLMNNLIRRAEELPENGETLQTIPMAAGDGVRFFDDVIVISLAEKVAVFASTCPHMGCRINRSESGELVCPCHGSRFNLRGEVVNGPAGHNLRPLEFEVDKAAATLRITLNRKQVRPL